MSRLIDADLLKKSLAEWGRGGNPQETTMVKLEDILISFGDEIDEQPTAYNVDAVVAELEKQAERHRNAGFDMERKGFNIASDMHYGKQVVYLKAIDIVRKGGAE